MAEETSLFPSVDVPDFLEETEEFDTEYKPSPMWDLEKGDFVRTATNNVPMNSGIEAFKVWCIKMVATERFSCLAYSDDLGTEMEDAVAEEDSEAIETAIERTIIEALSVNPRTSAVENFEFEWNADTVHVTFTVVGVDEEEFTVETDIEV